MSKLPYFAQPIRGSFVEGRALMWMGDRETRWVEDYLHRISKAIVQEAVAHGCEEVAFEELTDIRERMPGAKKFHVWAFRRLYDYVAYKAKAEGSRPLKSTRCIRPSGVRGVGRHWTRTDRLKRRSVARSAATRSILTTTRRRISAFDYSVQGKSLRTEGRHVTSP